MSRATADSPDRIGVAILARAPIPGWTKTRLIPRVGAAGAAKLHRWLLHRTVAAALLADVGPVALWCTPSTDHPDFAACRAFGPVTLHTQPEGDLGARMLAAIRDSGGSAGTLAIGTDCPVLSPAIIRDAAAHLHSGDDAVVVPAEDGGYVLIGLRRAASEPFAGVDWGSGHVMAQTRERLRQLGWRWSEPTTLWDVDRAADFERLVALVPELRTLIGETS